MEWNIDFISYEDFKKHVSETINQYGKKLESFNMEKFNKNIVDPIKMIFDKAIYNEDWKTLISSEIFRQRDKSSSNEIGYFHQNLFSYIENCKVPKEGWDVIYEGSEGYTLENGNNVKRIYVELKNKHNTMNSSSSAKTYMKMQNQLLNDDNCVCFLVEVIAKKSQNIVWETRVDGQKVSHNRIRRVSIDKFYEIITGERDAFYKICMALPNTVKEVIENRKASTVPDDTVLDEIEKVSEGFIGRDKNLGMILSMYMLGFETYNEFDSIFKSNTYLKNKKK
ncbi:MAG: Eco47II family restriction endonuclease [Peptoniphilaceae bacterium]|nr:Eco47II family restriction endonuclease [Peptoniphilaceae bacterium]MDY3738575.1 Eco47II family restriction endonuclease [Peptoniphilaceae bacterium]